MARLRPTQASKHAALSPQPNTNHIGLYVAKSKGYYDEAGLCCTLLSPHVDGYKATPASKLETGQADFAVAPSETVISHHCKPKQPVPIQVGEAPGLPGAVSPGRRTCRLPQALLRQFSGSLSV